MGFLSLLSFPHGSLMYSIQLILIIINSIRNESIK